MEKFIRKHFSVEIYEEFVFIIRGQGKIIGYHSYPVLVSQIWLNWTKSRICHKVLALSKRRLLTLMHSRIANELTVCH